MAELYPYDIEVYPNLFMCTVKRRSDSKYLTYMIGVVPSKDKGVLPLEFNDLNKLVQLFTDPKKWFVGYNSFHYDDQIMAFLIQNFRNLSTCTSLDISNQIHDLSSDIIHYDNNDYKYRSYFNSLDMMRMGRKGNQRKALKRQAVNLKHELIQDLPIPPGSTIYVHQVKKLRYYNINDVDITDKLCTYFIGDIALRRRLSLAYGLNLMNEGGESGIAAKLLLKSIAQEMGVHPEELKNQRTERKEIEIKDCIPSYINFQTKLMRTFLSQLKLGKIKKGEKFQRRIRIKETYYDVMTGGLHSVNPSCVYTATDTVKIKDCDVSSFYPWLILNNDVAPAHLGDSFRKVYGGVVAERMIAKTMHGRCLSEGKLDEAKEWDLKAKNQKIMVNAGYGQMGSPFSFMYDPLAMYKVTIAGQLSLLMLIERLELAGIKVFYANTDGITALVPVEKEQDYVTICEEWQHDTQLELEFEDYKKCVIRNVNNYLIVKTNGKTKAKGSMDRDAYKNLSDKMLFDKPIIPHALHEYFVNDIPVEETINNHSDIHDFCMAKKIGPTYECVMFRRLVRNGPKGAYLKSTEVQRTNRYFVTDNSEYGGVLQKIKYIKDSRGFPLKDPDKGKPTNVCSGELVYLANNMRTLPSNLKPKYSWYVKEARKIINEFEGQLSLFG